MLARLIDLYSAILLIDVFLSWMVQDPRHPARVFLGRLTDPVLDPIRKLMPTPGLDFSPMIALLVLQSIRRGLV